MESLSFFKEWQRLKLPRYSYIQQILDDMRLTNYRDLKQLALNLNRNVDSDLKFGGSGNKSFSLNSTPSIYQSCLPLIHFTDLKFNQHSTDKISCSDIKRPSTDPDPNLLYNHNAQDSSSSKNQTNVEANNSQNVNQDGKISEDTIRPGTLQAALQSMLMDKLNFLVKCTLPNAEIIQPEEKQALNKIQIQNQDSTNTAIMQAIPTSDEGTELNNNDNNMNSSVKVSGKFRENSDNSITKTAIDKSSECYGLCNFNNVGCKKEVEIKDESLIKTAISAMLLDSVSTVCGYTPSSNPNNEPNPCKDKQSQVNWSSLKKSHALNEENLAYEESSNCNECMEGAPVVLEDIEIEEQTNEQSRVNRASLKKSHILGSVKEHNLENCSKQKSDEYIMGLPGSLIDIDIDDQYITRIGKQEPSPLGTISNTEYAVNREVGKNNFRTLQSPKNKPDPLCILPSYENIDRTSSNIGGFVDIKDECVTSNKIQAKPADKLTDSSGCNYDKSVETTFTNNQFRSTEYISEVLKNVHIKDESLVKTAMQAMLLVKVGVIGTCTPPVSPRGLVDDDCSSLRKEKNETNTFFPSSVNSLELNMKINDDKLKNNEGIHLSKQQKKILTPNEIESVHGISDAIHDVEIKDEGLLKNAIQAMLLDKVGVVGTYTPPTSPNIRSPEATQFSSLKKKLNMPKSASHVNFKDYVKKQSRETVLGVPFTSVANLRAEILKRQQSQPCFTEGIELAPSAQQRFNLLRNGQNRMSDTQLDKPLVRSMLNESLEKKKRKFKCFHLKRKNLFSFLHKNQDCSANEKKEHKSIISRLFHRKTKEEDPSSSHIPSSFYPEHAITNTNKSRNNPSDTSRSVRNDTSTTSYQTNNACVTPGTYTTSWKDDAKQNQEKEELEVEDIYRRFSDSDQGIVTGVSLIGVALGLDKKHNEENWTELSENNGEVREVVMVENKMHNSNLNVESKPSSSESQLITCKQTHDVSITPLPNIPDAAIGKYLGNLNLFFTFPSNVEEQVTNNVIDNFIINILAILKAYVTALGGNAMVSLFLNNIASTHTNQGQCLINVGGDVVSVSYFNADT